MSSSQKERLQACIISKSLVLYYSAKEKSEEKTKQTNTYICTTIKEFDHRGTGFFPPDFVEAISDLGGALFCIGAGFGTSDNSSVIS